jgi:G:T/U-mismatch repair DNA glycosylase
MLETTNHQFKYSDFYVPEWELEHLFIGTFNPEFGQKVPYYYGRPSNYFWRIITDIFVREISPEDNELFSKLRELKIGCIDLVDSLTYNKQEYHNMINGEGYSDNVLFKKKNNIEKSYNTQKIIDLIKINNLDKVYFTNKGHVFIKEQKEEMKLIEKFCTVIYLSSPSQSNVHRKSLDSVIDDWKTNIF